MRLTRRDALVALAAAGVSAAGGATLLAEEGQVLSADGIELLSTDEGEDGGSAAIGHRERAVLVAAAEVLFPSELEDVGSFVERYVRGRSADRPDLAVGIADAAGYLDDYAESWYDEGFAALDAASRDETFRRMNVGTARPDPEGGNVQRVRYYVVNELLFALYASPTGGELVGIENPQGHPGGIESYRQGPGR